MHKTFKWLVRQALRLFFSHVVVDYPAQPLPQGPLLVVANHPNSFLDAIVIGACFEDPLYFLARGDAFENPFFRWLLQALRMVPIYRMREGRDQVRRNRESFDTCQSLLAQNKSLLIFIEGICVNQHQLQPFKKGAARMALEYRGQHPLRVLPVGIAFEHLRGRGKAVQVRFGQTQTATKLLVGPTDWQQVQAFNQSLAQLLNRLIVIPAVRNSSHAVNPPLRQVVKWFHWPWLFVGQILTKKFTQGTVFYDSVLFATLFLGYPLYLLAWFCLLWVLGKNALWAGLVIALQVLLLAALRTPRFYPNKRPKHPPML